MGAFWLITKSYFFFRNTNANWTLHFCFFNVVGNLTLEIKRKLMAYENLTHFWRNFFIAGKKWSFTVQVFFFQENYPFKITKALYVCLIFFLSFFLLLDCLFDTFSLVCCFVFVCYFPLFRFFYPKFTKVSISFFNLSVAWKCFLSFFCFVCLFVCLFVC